MESQSSEQSHPEGLSRNRILIRTQEGHLINYDQVLVIRFNNEPQGSSTQNGLIAESVGGRGVYLTREEHTRESSHAIRLENRRRCYEYLLEQLLAGAQFIDLSLVEVEAPGEPKEKPSRFE